MMKTKQESGQAIIIFAMALTGLLAFTALTVDLGRLFVERRNAQSAADSAALASAITKIRNQDALTLVQLKAAISNAAIAVAQSNGFPAETVVTNYPPVRPGKPYDGNMDYVQVTITSHFDTFFIHMFGFSQLQNTSEAVVLANGNASFLGGDLIWGANRTQCDTISQNGTVNVVLTNGNLFTNSTGTTGHGCTGQALDVRGTSGSLTVSKDASGNYTGNLYSVGPYHNTGGPTVSPTPTVGMPQRSVPNVPAPDCTVRANFPAGSGYHSSGNETVNNNDHTTIDPGNYGFINVKSGGDLTLNPGLYCIDNYFTVTGNIQVAGDKATASGVTLVFNGGTLDFSGAARLVLWAPKSPFNLKAVNGNTVNYAGMLIYGNPGSYPGTDTSQPQFDITGGTYTDLEGAIFLPTANCRVRGSSTFNSVNTQLVCNMVDLAGSNNLNLSLDLQNPFNFGGFIKLMQ